MDEVAVLDLLPEAVVCCDADGRIVRVNARAEGLLGLTSAAVGAPLEEALAAADRGGRPCRLWRPRPAVGQRRPEEIAHVWVGERWRPVAVGGSWDERGGGVLTFRHAGRRERLDAVRGDVVATVSHELRSPLTTVKGFTRTLLAKWDRFGDEQKRTMLETIDADADRVTRLLGELLDVSRIDAGRVQLHRRPLDLASLAEEVVERLRAHEIARDRELRVEVVDAPPAVHADGDKCSQVLHNLVENALRHAGHGPVTIRVAPADHGRVRVSVIDRGPGVPVEQRDRVFDKFGRGRRRGGPGTGLGLYITRGLVEAHGGRVWLDRDVEQGATFHVELPVDGGGAVDAGR